MNGFQVNPAALDVTAEGVQGVLEELGQLGIDGQQTSGSPVTALALSQQDAGDELVSLMLQQLLDRAHYVLRDLLRNAEQMVQRLQTNRTHYQQVEHSITATFTALGEALMGAPDTEGTGAGGTG